VTEDEFWAIVERSRSQARGRVEHQPAAVEKVLAALPPDEILAFRRHLLDANDRGYTWDLAAAAHLLLGGISEDTFTNLRTWLVCHGRETFQRVIADPDSLADLPLDPGAGEFGFAEEFGYLPDEAYEHVTGEDPPDEPGEAGVDEPPAGAAIDLDDAAALRARFPRIAARVGRPG